MKPENDTVNRNVPEIVLLPMLQKLLCIKILVVQSFHYIIKVGNLNASFNLGLFIFLVEQRSKKSHATLRGPLHCKQRVRSYLPKSTVGALSAPSADLKNAFSTKPPILAMILLGKPSMEEL